MNIQQISNKIEKNREREREREPELQQRWR